MALAGACRKSRIDGSAGGLTPIAVDVRLLRRRLLRRHLSKAPMRIHAPLFHGIASLAMASAPAYAQAPQPATSLTVYSTTRAMSPEMYRNGARGQAVPGYAVVRQDRNLTLDRGRNTLRYTDVAAFIDPTTVAFESLTDPAGTRVVEQNFQFDLVSQEKLLQKYIDREVSVDQVRGSSVETFTGTLLSTAGGLVLRRPDGSIQTLPSNAGVRLPEVPGGLITRPTLVWDLEAAKAGPHQTRVSYQTAGVTWWADYNLVYRDGATANECKLDVNAWVSIVNQSGASYNDARLKLIAGDVQRVAPMARSVPAPLNARAAVMEDRAAGFEEKPLFEYHLYTLGRATTLPDQSTKQIELFPAAHGAACEKALVYSGQAAAYPYGSSPYTDRSFGTPGNKKVDVYLRFRNTAQNHMGMPLPAGRMRVSKMDAADRAMEFVGEDFIDHTPANEQLQIRMGSAFDVVGERRQTGFTVDTSRKSMTEEIEIKVRNQKKEPVTVVVKENLYRWTSWQVTQKSHEFTKADARTVHFPVKIAAGAEAIVRYTVVYTW
jgi:hypothetical protein